MRCCEIPYRFFYAVAVDFVGLYRQKRWYEEFFFVKKIKKSLEKSPKNVIFVVDKREKYLLNLKINSMNHYVNCENAKKAVAKVVTYFPGYKTGKVVHFFGDYESAEKYYESTNENRMFQLGFEVAELYFRGVRNIWVEMVAED